MKKVKVLFFFYNRLQDPLLQSNIFLFINEITQKQDNQYQFSIITFEDKNFPMSDSERAKITEGFLRRNIIWEPLQWHHGDNLLIKLVDLFLALFKILKLRTKGYKHLVTLGSVAGSFVYLISRIIPVKYYLYQYEPHSEYLRDSHVWKTESLQFKLLNLLEKRSVMKCAVVSSGTKYMQERLIDWKVNKPFIKITSVANDSAFNFSEHARNKIRKELLIQPENKLIIYPGKIGGIYADEIQLVELIKAMAPLDVNYRFLIITPSINELNNKLLRESDDLKKVINIIPPSPLEKMPEYLSAADLGIVSVMPGYSQRFRSNIKVGEYLCTGLPYLVCKGISEDDLVAETQKVGVVIQDFKPEHIRSAKASFDTIFAVSKIEMVERCRTAGINYRGFSDQNKQFNTALTLLVSN